ncbi:ABC transporter ATP-binding protein [Aerococcus urinae]
MANIELNSVYKKYDNAEDYSVTDFNLNINHHEFIVFVGPSGCGKSTTLRMIAGLEEITEGSLIIDGDLVNDVAPKDRDIAMVFQNYALYPHMSVYNNMAFGLKLRKVDKKEIDKRINEAAKMLGIEEYLDSKPSSLSGGQRQRVALGRAVVRDPKVFLMDEPLSNLDAKLRVRMRTEIAKLHKKLDATTIYVTHDQTEAMTLADRIVIMNEGIIQQVGTPLEVYNEPVNTFVGTFIGSPSMNLMEVLYQDGRIISNSLNLSVTEPDKKILEQSGYNNKKIIFGIRPEDIHTERIVLDTFKESTTKAKVTVSEMTGADAILYLDINEQEICAVVDIRDYQPSNNDIDIAFNMSKAHFFDNDSKIRIK